MNAYRVDRSLLEAHSTAEIRRILRDERDDYTPEAIKVFEEILEERGVSTGSHTEAAMVFTSGSANRSAADSEDRLIRSPADAIRVLDEVLQGVLRGSVEPPVGQAASGIVMAILRAMELEYVSETEEEACSNRSCRP
jgi:hypothetical protein